MWNSALVKLPALFQGHLRVKSATVIVMRETII